MTHIEPLPGADVCSVCRGPAHIYEVDFSIDEEGKSVCGNCTRNKRKYQGRDPRQIDRHHHWKHGHDPSDDDAQLGSPYEYIKLERQNAVAPVTGREELRGGPESGVKCLNCGTMTRIAADRTVEQMLKATGYVPPAGTVAPKDRIYILVCPSCQEVMQWRQEFLERERRRVLGVA